jgi:hypothetical protein
MTTFLDCPAHLDKAGTVTCGLPAEIRYRYVTASTDGPMENAMIRCPSGHWFNGPIEFLAPASRTAGRTNERSAKSPVSS